MFVDNTGEIQLGCEKIAGSSLLILAQHTKH